MADIWITFSEENLNLCDIMYAYYHPQTKCPLKKGVYTGYGYYTSKPISDIGAIKAILSKVSLPSFVLVLYHYYFIAQITYQDYYEIHR